MALASTTIAPAHSSTEHSPKTTMADAPVAPAINDNATHHKVANKATTNTHDKVAADKIAADIAALTTAVSHNDISTVKALLRREVDLRPAHWYDTPVLVIAAQQGYFEIVQLLITARANVNTGYNRLPLHSAAENGYLPIVSCLLKAGAYPEAQDSRGYTALVASAAAGQLAVVKALLVHIRHISRAEVEQAMSLAAQGRHQEVCAFIQSTFLPQQAELQAKQELAEKQSAPVMLSIIDEMIEKSTIELNKTLFSAPNNA